HSTPPRLQVHPPIPETPTRQPPGPQKRPLHPKMLVVENPDRPGHHQKDDQAGEQDELEVVAVRLPEVDMQKEAEVDDDLHHRQSGQQRQPWPAADDLEGDQAESGGSQDERQHQSDQIRASLAALLAADLLGAVGLHRITPNRKTKVKIPIQTMSSMCQ